MNDQTHAMENLDDIMGEVIDNRVKYEESLGKMILREIQDSSEITIQYPDDDEILQNIPLIKQTYLYLYCPNEDSETISNKLTLFDLAKEVINVSMEVGSPLVAAKAFEEMASLIREVEKMHLEIYEMIDSYEGRITVIEDIHAKWPGEEVSPSEQEIEELLRQNGPFDERKGFYLLQLEGVSREFRKKLFLERLLIPNDFLGTAEEIFHYVAKRRGL